MRLAVGVAVVVALSGVRNPASHPDLDKERAELICIGRVVEQYTDPPLREVLERRLPHITLTSLDVRVVLKGDSETAGKRIVVEEKRTVPHLAAWPDACYLAALRRREGNWSLVGRPYRITCQKLDLPTTASWRDKTTLALLATLRTDNPQLISAAFWQLGDHAPPAESPYYNLLSEYRRFDGHSNSYFEGRALRARLLLKDASALPRALALATSKPLAAGDIAGLLDRFGDDAVTTLCLIADGKLIPGRKRDAVHALRRIASPASLPMLVKLLDDPEVEIQYVAYTAIEKIRTAGEFITTGHDFHGRSPTGRDGLGDDRPTTHSRMLVNQMKDWWDVLGKRQFDYVLTDEGKK